MPGTKLNMNTMNISAGDLRPVHMAGWARNMAQWLKSFQAAGFPLGSCCFSSPWAHGRRHAGQLTVPGSTSNSRNNDGTQQLKMRLRKNKVATHRRLFKQSCLFQTLRIQVLNVVHPCSLVKSISHDFFL